MNIFYSQSRLTSFCRSSIGLLPKYHTYPFRSLQYRSYYALSSNKPQNEPENVEQYIISEEELVTTDYFKPKTFFERNKVTLGLFGSSIVFSYLGRPIISSVLFWASFVSLFKAERYHLKLRKLYEDVYGMNAQRYENLNNLLADLMVKNEELKKYVKKDTLIFTNNLLTQKSHAENRIFKHDAYESMQRRYTYTLLFFDTSTGAEGRISSQCVYNYDKDYYFRLIYVYLVSPTTKVIKIEDNRNVVDI